MDPTPTIQYTILKWIHKPKRKNVHVLIIHMGWPDYNPKTLSEKSATKSKTRRNPINQE